MCDYQFKINQKIYFSIAYIASPSTTVSFGRCVIAHETVLQDDMTFWQKNESFQKSPYLFVFQRTQIESHLNGADLDKR